MESLPNENTVPEQPTYTILDVETPKEPKSPEVTIDHVGILTKQLESGESSHFDTGFVDLLEEVNANKDKSAIAHSLINTGIISFKTLGSKAVGILGGIEAGVLGQQYFTNKAQAYLSERLLLDPTTVKAIPGHAMEGAKEAVHSVTKDIDPAIVEAAKKTTGQFKDAFHSLGNLFGHHPIEKGAEIVKSGAAHGVDVSVEGINHTVIQPAIESASDAVGWTSYLPSAAIGYLLASGFAGGVAGVIQERREKNSFAHYSDLIAEVNSFKPEDNPVSFEQDPRVKLAVEFKRISETPDKTKYSFTKEEWLLFAAGAREAKCSLLRSKTRAAEITLPEEHPVLERKVRAIDGIMLNEQSQLAEADMELAKNILVQFDTRLTQEMSPLEKENALQNTVSRKILRYSKTFVKSGLNATGIPTLWKATKLSLKVARKVILPI